MPPKVKKQVRPSSKVIEKAKKQSARKTNQEENDAEEAAYEQKYDSRGRHIFRETDDGGLDHLRVPGPKIFATTEEGTINILEMCDDDSCEVRQLKKVAGEAQEAWEEGVRDNIDERRSAEQALSLVKIELEGAQLDIDGLKERLDQAKKDKFLVARALITAAAQNSDNWPGDMKSSLRETFVSARRRDLYNYVERLIDQATDDMEVPLLD